MIWSRPKVPNSVALDTPSALVWAPTYIVLISVYLLSPNCWYPPTGPQCRNEFSSLFFPGMPQCVSLLLDRSISTPTPCQTRAFLSESFPPLIHPRGCTINADISPEQNVFEKYFRWMPGLAAQNVMVTFQRDLPGARVSKNSHCSVQMWKE